ncbi:MAG TPA: DUF3060 domain-containing protein [Pseudonocardiaceae bacterium]|jgi:hypothetical protein
MNLTRAAAGPLVAVIVLVTLTACTNGGPPTGLTAQSGAATQPPASAQNTGNGNAGNANTGGGNAVNGLPVGGLPTNLPGGVAGSLPAGFPLPTGSTTQSVITADGNVAATVQVSDTSSAYQFWLSALPQAGYQIVGQPALTNVNGEAIAGIELSGHGYGSDSGIQITNHTATIALTGGGSAGGGTGTGGGGGGTINVTQSGTYTCNGGETVTIADRGGMSVTINGHCASVEVDAGGNTVTVADTDKIDVAGAGNTVTYGGNPSISNGGTGNTVRHS